MAAQIFSNFTLRLFLSMLEVLTFWCEWIVSLKNKTYLRMHMDVFEDSYTAFALYKKNKQFITLYNYNNISFLYLFVLYLLHLLGLKNRVLKNKKRLACRIEFDTIKYCIFSYYSITGLCYEITTDEANTKEVSDAIYKTLPNHLAFALIDIYDVTEITKLMLHSLQQCMMMVNDFVTILYHLRYIPYLPRDDDISLQVLNMNMMEEQVFKGNDIICL